MAQRNTRADTSNTPKPRDPKHRIKLDVKHVNTEPILTRKLSQKLSTHKYAHTNTNNNYTNVELVKSIVREGKNVTSLSCILHNTNRNFVLSHLRAESSKAVNGFKIVHKLAQM